jgi:hypothetical protein
MVPSLRGSLATCLAFAIVAASPRARAQVAPLSVALTLDADNPRVTLSRRVGELPFGRRLQMQGLWEDMCLAPCGDTLPLRALYRIDGEGITPSGSFFLDPRGGRLHVQAGSANQRAWGLVLTLIGSSFVLAGGMTAAFSLIPEDHSSPSAAAQSRDAHIAFEWTGGALLVTGAVALVFGIPMLASSGTTVTDDAGHDVAAARPKIYLTPTGLAF